MKKVIKYKGIVFDDFSENEDGTYWSEICQECARKYQEKIREELDDGGTARGICGVCNCFNSGEDLPLHFYIDFKPEHVELIEVESVEVVEDDWH